jgi:hypothetical protein
VVSGCIGHITGGEGKILVWPFGEDIWKCGEEAEYLLGGGAGCSAEMHLQLMEIFCHVPRHENSR